MLGKFGFEVGDRGIRPCPAQGGGVPSIEVQSMEMRLAGHALRSRVSGPIAVSGLAYMTLWFAGCVALMLAPPALFIAARPLRAIAGTAATAAGWMLLLRVAPSDLGMAGGMLLFAIWGLSAFTALAAIVVRCARL